MPVSTAQISKATIEAALSNLISDWRAHVTSSAGNAGGTTFAILTLGGYGPDAFKNMFALITSGTNAGEWRLITASAETTGVFTVDRAFTAQVAGSVTIEIHLFQPTAFTIAVNNAIISAGKAIYKPVNVYVQAPTGRYGSSHGRAAIGLPRNMRHVNRVLYAEGYGRKLYDQFDREASTSSAGGQYVATTGTWGVIGERLYSASDANADHLTYDVDLGDLHISAVVTGTLNNASTYRSPALTFRILENYNQDIDTNNYLIVRLLNDVVDLRKMDAGSESSLVTATHAQDDGVDYHVRILAIGNRIKVWIDDVELISYQLLGTNLKYLDGRQTGIRLDKGGSPATAARIDNYAVHHINAMIEWPNWQQDADNAYIRLGDRYNYTSGLFLVEGMDHLTLLAADTTYGTLASFTTATLEIEADDPAYLTLLAYAAHHLYAQAGAPAIAPSQDDKAMFDKEATKWLATAKGYSSYLKTPRHNNNIKRPM